MKLSNFTTKGLLIRVREESSKNLTDSEKFVALNNFTPPFGIADTDTAHTNRKSEFTDMIQEIFAETAYGVRVYDKTSEPYDSYIINCRMKIFGIPDDLTDDDEEDYLAARWARLSISGRSRVC